MIHPINVNAAAPISETAAARSGCSSHHLSEKIRIDKIKVLESIINKALQFAHIIRVKN